MAKLALKNIKKAIVIADDYLTNGQLPSGKTWSDVYGHVLSRWHEINPIERIFTGFMAFVALTAYNEGRKSKLAVLATKDEDGGGRNASGRAVARKKAKLTKDMGRSADTGSPNGPFAKRGLSMDTRIQLIEVAQLEDQKCRDTINTTILQLNAKNDLLLRERSQQIDLAKIICPQYDVADENWNAVKVLTNEIKSVKQDLKTHEENRLEVLKKDSSSTKLAHDFLQSFSEQNVSTVGAFEKTPGSQNVAKEVVRGGGIDIDHCSNMNSSPSIPGISASVGRDIMAEHVVTSNINGSIINVSL